MSMHRARLAGATLAIAVIAVSAIAKFADLPGFLMALKTWRLVPDWAVSSLVVLVPSPPRPASSRARARSAGFTLIEAILVIALIGLLVGLGLPSVARVKTKALAMVTLADLRTHATIATAYASDFKDSFICILDPAYTHTVVDVPGTSQRETLAYFEQRFYWWYGLVDYYGGNTVSQSFFAPRKDGPGRLSPYYYTVSGLARPQYWRRETRTPTGQIGPMRLADVLYPARKGLFANLGSNSARRRLLRDYIDLEASFCDGSAQVTQRDSLLPPVPGGEGPRGWPYSFDPFGDAITHTADGVRGADLR